MTDAGFTRAFERLEIPPDEVNHRAHLRLAWVYLSESPSIEAATARMADAITRFAASVGKSDKYSDAITALWMKKMAAARNAMPAASFSDLIAANPDLLVYRPGPEVPTPRTPAQGPA